MKTKTSKWIVAGAMALALISLGKVETDTLAANGPVEVRLGTLAPSGTSYHKILQGMGEKWRQSSGGSVKLTIFPDGRLGGEADMVRLMRVGQISSGMLTVVGLSDIDNSVACLQYMPMMFRSWEELDHVREKLRPQLEKRLLDKGFVVLFWGDAGWVRYFSKTAAVRPADFKKMKIFAWAGDTAQADLMKALGYQPISLETADILPGLQTGLINTIPTTPFYALAGQFDCVAPHMLELNWSPIVGATLIKKETWDKIPTSLHSQIRDAAASAGEQMRASSRAENEKSVAAMQKRGLKVHPVTPEIEAEWRSFAETIHPKIRGKMVPADMFDEVQRLLAEYRASDKRGAR